MRTSTVCESGAHSRSGIGQDMDHHRDKERRVEVTTDEFRALFEAVSNWDRWGPDDERGALNYLTADCILAAVRLVRTGETLSLSPVSYTHLRAHETDSYLVCRLLLEKKKKPTI